MLGEERQSRMRINGVTTNESSKDHLKCMDLLTPTSVYDGSNVLPISDYRQSNNTESTKKITSTQRKDKILSSANVVIKNTSKVPTVSIEKSATSTMVEDANNSTKEFQFNSGNNNTVKKLVIDLSNDSDVGEEYFITEHRPTQVTIDLTNDDSNSDTDNNSKRKRTERKNVTPSKIRKHLYSTLVSHTLDFTEDDEFESM